MGGASVVVCEVTQSPTANGLGNSPHLKQTKKLNFRILLCYTNPILRNPVGLKARCHKVVLSKLTGDDAKEGTAADKLHMTMLLQSHTTPKKPHK